MLFLVTAEWVEVGAMLTPEQIRPVVETAVMPSLELWAQWEEEGKIKGGVFPGERAGVFVLEAASSEEVGELLTSLPFWGLMKWHVRPLQSARSAVEREQKTIEKMKAGSSR